MAAAKKSAPVEKAVARKAATANAAPAKKAVPTKKAAAAKKTSVAKTPPQTKPSSTPEAAQLQRIIKGLSKMGVERPEKLKSFLRHVENMLGKDAGSSAGQQMLQQLEKAGVIQISGEKVIFKG